MCGCVGLEEKRSGVSGCRGVGVDGACGDVPSREGREGGRAQEGGGLSGGGGGGVTVSAFLRFGCCSSAVEAVAVPSDVCEDVESAGSGATGTAGTVESGTAGSGATAAASARLLLPAAAKPAILSDSGGGARMVDTRL